MGFGRWADGDNRRRERAQLLAGQARRLTNDIEQAATLVRRGERDEAARLLDTATIYANFVAAWLEDIARPPRGESPIRGSRGDGERLTET
jgi:hypothetical protein